MESVSIWTNYQMCGMMIQLHKKIFKFQLIEVIADLNDSSFSVRIEIEAK